MIFIGMFLDYLMKCVLSSKLELRQEVSQVIPSSLILFASIFEKLKPYKTISHHVCLVNNITISFPHVFAKLFGGCEGDKETIGSKSLAQSKQRVDVASGWKGHKEYMSGSISSHCISWWFGYKEDKTKLMFSRNQVWLKPRYDKYCL